MSPGSPPDTAALTTPLGWTDGEGLLVGGNPALARWLGVSLRRLPGLPLAALEADGDLLARGLRELRVEPARDVLRLRRLALAFPGFEEPRFADISLSRLGEGWLLEAHPVEEFPGEDPAVALRTRAELGVRIGDEAHSLALRLEIVDDGRGVPEELAERVFLPLVTGRAEGTGLGLALAQQVAREHRGSLVYRSRPGHTVFTLLLPLEAPDHGP